jgi:hypothetical protein
MQTRGMEKRALQPCKPSFLSARYNVFNRFPEFARPDVIKPACFGALTMQRFLFAFVVAAMALAYVTHACAERNFPQQARRGDLKAYHYPSMKIGDNIYRLAAGSRIYNQQNLIIMPASLQVQSAPVMYVLDLSGELSRIWLLTKGEAMQYPLPR